MNLQSIAFCDCFTWVSSHLFWCSVDGTHQILKETRARNQTMPKTVCIANVLQISIVSSLRPPVQYSIMIIMLIHVHPPPPKNQNAKTQHHLLQDYFQLVSRYFTGAPFNKISRPLVATVRSPKRTSLPEEQLWHSIERLLGIHGKQFALGVENRMHQIRLFPLEYTANSHCLQESHCQNLLPAETALMEVSTYSHNHP